MKQYFIKDGLITVLLGVFLLMGVSADATMHSHKHRHRHVPDEPASRPNILLIVADDLGYSDIGAYGGEISTPHMDNMAQASVMMTNFHSAATCSPTRAMLMSGTSSHLAGLGHMYEAQTDLTDEQLASENYAGYLIDSVEAFPEKLKDAGYHTYMAGKWHLANRADEESMIATSAAARGFERSFTLLQGGSSFFDDMLGINPFSQVSTYMEDDAFVTELPEGFYATKYYTDKLIEYIEEDKDDDQPFFAYAAYTAPHWPLQVPDEWLDKYQGRYDAGYDVLRQERIARMKALGIIPQDAATYPRLDGVPAWDSLTAEEKQREARAMEIYAAMVEYMDGQIGRLLDYLKEIGEYDNTLIVFMSDNGMEGYDPHNYWPPYIPGVTSGAIDSFSAKLDESYDNMGKPGSYVYLSEGWGQVGVGVHRDYKSDTTEGGIRTPMFVRYPKTSDGGIIDDQFCTVMDLAPTFLEVARADLPKQPLKGESMVKFLKGKKRKIHRRNYGFGMEFADQQAYFMDDYKIYRETSEDTWELFDLRDDPGETMDLSGERRYRRLYRKLQKKYEAFANEVGVIAP